MRSTRLPKQTGAAALAATASGPFVHASDKAGSDHPVIGKGEHRYECFHNWGEVPSSIRWFETHGVAIDKAGFIYIKHRAGDHKPKPGEQAQDTIVVFDPDGKFVRSFGKEYHGGGHGIDIREENGQEFLYLSCMMPVNLVVKTDLKGEVVWIKKAPAGAARLRQAQHAVSPTNVAFAPDGGFYVSDGYGSNYIHEYDKDAKWVRTFGGTGDGPGQYKTPHGLWLDNRPGREVELVVADRANARLQYLTLDGQPVEHGRGQSASRPTSTSGAMCCWCPTCTPASPCSTRTTRCSSTSVTTRRGPSRCSTGSRSAPSPTAGRPASSSTPTTPASIRTATSSSPSGWRPAGSRSCGTSVEAVTSGQDSVRALGRYRSDGGHSSGCVGPRRP